MYISYRRIQIKILEHVIGHLLIFEFSDPAQRWLVLTDFAIRKKPINLQEQTVAPSLTVRTCGASILPRISNQ